MLTPSDVVRAAGLGVRLELDEPLVTDWRAKYIEQRRISWEYEQNIAEMRAKARRCQVYRWILFALLVWAALFAVAGWLR